MSAEAFLNEVLGKSAVVMFATRTCPFCHRASLILGKVTSDVKTFYIDRMDNGDAVFGLIEKRFNHGTVPAIFVKGKFIGGCDDMESLYHSGELKKLLAGSN